MNHRTRDLKHYEEIGIVFWYILNDMPPFKQNDKIPCIYVERRDDKLFILDFDNAIESDQFTYTAWRKFIGQTYGIRVEVLLIKDGLLYSLKGDIVDFDSLGRSDVWVDQKYLARTGYK